MKQDREMCECPTLGQRVWHLFNHVVLTSVAVVLILLMVTYGIQ